MTFQEIIAAAEFDHYGVRAHRSAAIVGGSLGKSRVWIDGEPTEEELDGISTIKVTAGTVDLALEIVRRTYCWSDETIVLVGGYVGAWGDDDGEFVIRDNVCLAVL